MAFLKDFVSRLLNQGRTPLDKDPQDFRDLIKTADMPRIENRQTLRDFYGQIHSHWLTPATTRIGIGWYGDSTGPLISGYVARIMLQGLAGGAICYPGANGAAISYTTSGTALLYTGITEPVDQTVLDGTGGKADFTYVPTAQHMKLASGSIVTFDNGQNTGYTIGRVYLAVGPGFGSALVELFDRNAPGVALSSQTINCSAGSLNATKAEFTGLNPATKYGMRVTSTGVTVICHTAFLKANGLVLLTMNRGTSTLTQNNYSNANIFTYICNDMGMGLMFLSAKEEGDPTVTIPAAMTRLGLLSATSKFVIGTLPDSSGDAGVILQNAQFRQYALAAGAASFSAFWALGSYAEAARLNWNNDPTHLDTPAHDHAGGLIMGELLGPLALGTSERRSVRQRDGGDVSSYLFYVYSGNQDGTTKIQFVDNAGGANPNYAVIQNISKVYGGDPATSTTPTIISTGTGWQLKNVAGTDMPLALGAVTSSVASNFNGGITATTSGIPGTFVTSGTGGCIKVQATGSTGISAVVFADNAGAIKAYIGIGNSSAAVLANKWAVNTNSLPIGFSTNNGTTDTLSLVGLNATFAGYVKLAVKTVSGLGSASTAGAGACYFVSDATVTLAAGLGTTVAGGGSNFVRVYSDGTNWIVG